MYYNTNTEKLGIRTHHAVFVEMCHGGITILSFVIFLQLFSEAISLFYYFFHYFPSPLFLLKRCIILLKTMKYSWGRYVCLYKMYVFSMFFFYKDMHAHKHRHTINTFWFHSIHNQITKWMGELKRENKRSSFLSLDPSKKDPFWFNLFLLWNHIKPYYLWISYKI